MTQTTIEPQEETSPAAIQKPLHINGTLDKSEAKPAEYNCYILTGKGVSDLRLTQKQVGSKDSTFFDPDWKWCFANQADAEEKAEKHSRTGKEIKVMPFFSDRARKKWKGTKLEKKSVGLETKYLIEKRKLDDKESDIKALCEKGKITFSFLSNNVLPSNTTKEERDAFELIKPKFSDWEKDRTLCEDLENEWLDCEETIKEKEKIKKSSSDDDDDEIVDGSEGRQLLQARVSARRKALLYGLSHDEIVKDINKHHHSLKNEAEEIASKAISWADKHETGGEVVVGGIPKKIADMKSLDLRFAQLEAPGQPCVTIHRSDAQPISNPDFLKRLSGEVVISGVDDKGQTKYLAASAFWSGNTNKHVYKRIVFTNQKVGSDAYNLFTGFGVKPKEGKFDRILDHVKNVICSGDETNYTALIRLLAWQMQNIGKPSRIITAVKSNAQQVGKGCFLADIMGVIYGNSGLVTSDLGQIITRFNDTIRGKAFIFLDEALFAGDRKSADKIKSLATATRQPIESKGIPTVEFPIAVNLFLATNHDDAAHVEESDARYWILEASPHRVGDTEYFKALYAEIEGGGRQAFMHYLLNLDVRNFVPSRDVPKDNASKEAMIRNSINPYDARKWLEECCHAGMILGLKPQDTHSKHPWELWIKGDQYPNGLFQTAYTEWQKTVKTPVAAKPTAANKFGELLTKAGLDLRIAKQRWRSLPDPDECLKTVVGMIEKIGKS